MKRYPSTAMLLALWTGSMIALVSVAFLGVYGIPVTAIAALLGFHLFSRWYHRRHQGDHPLG